MKKPKVEGAFNRSQIFWRLQRARIEHRLKLLGDPIEYSANSRFKEAKLKSPYTP